MRRIRSHLTFANAMSLVAVFIALGGAAYAANTVRSSDIVNDEVYSADVRNDTLAGGGLTAADLRGGAVATTEINDGAVRSADVADNSLKGGDVLEGTLDGLDATDGFDGVCDPSSTQFIDCDAAATITLERAMNVLLIATSHFRSVGTSAPAHGNCRLEQNDVAVSNDHPIGEFDVDTGILDQGGMNLVDVESLPAGTYTFEVSCNEVADDIEYPNIRVAAVELSQE